VKRCLEVLDLRERLIVKLAIIAGMRPGEIFGLTWGRLSGPMPRSCSGFTVAISIRRRPTSRCGKRHFPGGLAAEIEAWREFAVDAGPDGVGVSFGTDDTALEGQLLETAHSAPLAKVGLGWANFLVMRRTHASVMKAARGRSEAGCRPAWPQPRRQPERLHQGFGGARGKVPSSSLRRRNHVNGAQTEHRVEGVRASR
jgi:hypothetical protein